MRRTHNLAVVEPPLHPGHLIRAFRRQLGLTLEGLAHALGIALSTVSRWEHGHMTPSRLAWKALAKLAAEKGCPLPVESSVPLRCEAPAPRSTARRRGTKVMPAAMESAGAQRSQCSAIPTPM